MILGWMDTLVGKCCINSVKQRRQILSIAEPRDRWIQSGSRHIYGKLLRRFLSPWSFIMERYITWLPHSWPMTITTINCSFALLLWANYDRLYRCDDTILAKKKKKKEIERLHFAQNRHQMARNSVILKMASLDNFKPISISEI